MAFRKFLIVPIFVSLLLSGFSQKNEYKIQITISEVPDEMFICVELTEISNYCGQCHREWKVYGHF
jgi:hypothetical protein